MVPGHTAGHIAYVVPDPGRQPRCCFVATPCSARGCGRLFEGTPAQMLASLTRLAALPEATRVCCAHEYTLGNLRFARAVEPDNAALAGLHGAERRRCAISTCRHCPPPSVLKRPINPFCAPTCPAWPMRCRQMAPNAHDPVSVFAALRSWKEPILKTLFHLLALSASSGWPAAPTPGSTAPRRRLQAPDSGVPAPSTAPAASRSAASTLPAA